MEEFHKGSTTISLSCNFVLKHAVECFKHDKVSVSLFISTHLKHMSKSKYRPSLMVFKSLGYQNTAMQFKL